MDGRLQVEKSAIRRQMNARRKALPPEAKERAAAVICGRIAERTDLRGPVAVYLASPAEIDLSAAIRILLGRGVSVVAPRWNGETYELARVTGLDEADLRKGPMGILEPREPALVQPSDIAVWLVPGLAFTRDGGRLGYGGGWYDRLMSSADARALKLGVAYSFQIVDELPREPHDIRLDGVVDDMV